MSDLIVARVRRPHGVAGEVLIAVDTDRPRHVFRKGRVLHLGDERGRPVGRTLVLQGMRPTTGGAIVRLEGVDTREGADALRGHSFLIQGAEAAPADTDEIHYRDLVGMRVEADGVAVGTVDDLLEIQPGLTLVLRGSNGREILIPFVREMIEQVDLPGRTLKLRLPEGLLEL